MVRAGQNGEARAGVEGLRVLVPRHAPRVQEPADAVVHPQYGAVRLRRPEGLGEALPVAGLAVPCHESHRRPRRPGTRYQSNGHRVFRHTQGPSGASGFRRLSPLPLGGWKSLQKHVDTDIWASSAQTLADEIEYFMAHPN